MQNYYSNKTLESIIIDARQHISNLEYELVAINTELESVISNRNKRGDVKPGIYKRADGTLIVIRETLTLADDE